MKIANGKCKMLNNSPPPRGEPARTSVTEGVPQSSTTAEYISCFPAHTMSEVMNMSKKKLPKTQDTPETKRILPKTPNRAHTEMKAENAAAENHCEAEHKNKK